MSRLSYDYKLVESCTDKAIKYGLELQFCYVQVANVECNIYATQNFETDVFMVNHSDSNIELLDHHILSEST